MILQLIVLKVNLSLCLINHATRYEDTWGWRVYQLTKQKNKYTYLMGIKNDLNMLWNKQYILVLIIY